MRLLNFSHRARKFFFFFRLGGKGQGFFRFALGSVSLNNYPEHAAHSSHRSCLGSTAMGEAGNELWVLTTRELQGQEEEEEEEKEEEEASLPTNNPHPLTEVYSFKDPVCNQPFANSTKHLCLSLKRLPNNHRPMGYSSNETFNKSLSKVIYSPSEKKKKKWEKADSIANLWRGKLLGYPART